MKLADKLPTSEATASEAVLAGIRAIAGRAVAHRKKPEPGPRPAPWNKPFVLGIDENGMGPDGARMQWEQIEENERFGDRTEEELLTDLGYDFDALYKGFMAANTVMDYRQRRYHPEIDVADYIDELPAEGGESGSFAPEQHGQHYIQLADRAYDSDLPNLDLHFEGRAGGDWIALLVGASDDEVQFVLEVPLDDDIGDAQLEDWGQYDQVWLVVSPTSDEGEVWSYDWTLDASAPPEPEPEETDLPVDAGEDPSLVGCGCHPGAGPSSVFGFAVALALVTARRRRA
jgi:MYXO-CTERM domain-containing protein